MSLELINRPKVDILSDRALMMQKVRTFFAMREVMEVDCPIISHKASTDVNIDLIEATGVGKRVFLHSSPEFGMKRLLSYDIGDIYQLSHVFRDGEVGEKHNPEFMMCEWYRMGFSFEEMMQETAEFITLFLGKRIPSGSFETVSYHEAFLKYAEIDIEDSNKTTLTRKLCEKNTSYPKDASFQDLLDLSYTVFVEPNLGVGHLTAIHDFPPDQAALAQKTKKTGRLVAERFEFYFEGMELANGYHELSDAKEQAKRFEEDNETRGLLGKKIVPVDEELINALKRGIPDCCGVAVGFDRLMMLRHHAKHIADVIPFVWEES